MTPIETPTRGRNERRVDSPTPETTVGDLKIVKRRENSRSDSVFPRVDSLELAYRRMSLAKASSSDKDHSVRNETSDIPEGDILSIRHSHSFFLSLKVSRTLFLSRSKWAKAEMAKSDSSACSLDGNTMTIAFAAYKTLESYVQLLRTGIIKPLVGRHSLSTMFGIVNFYFLCVDLEDPISATLVLDEVRRELTHFQAEEQLSCLTTFIWKTGMEGNKEEMRALRREFRNWGLRVCLKWLPRANAWLEKHEESPEDLSAHQCTLFQKDVIYDYWMDQE